MSHQPRNLKNIGAVCILGFDPHSNDESPDDTNKYKVIYTKNCMSQIHKHYESQNQKIQVHLYKYCTKTDVQKIRDSLKLFRIEGEANKHCYWISLDELFDNFLKHFEPEMPI